MSSIAYQVETQISKADLLDLYSNANWTAYTNDVVKLAQAISQSLKVITARDGNKLVGLIRAVGDGLTILYIQDILVHTDYKRTGIGTELINRLLTEFPHVRQKVLLTDDNSETRGFYESIGFQSCDEGKLVAFVKLSNN